MPKLRGADIFTTPFVVNLNKCLWLLMAAPNCHRIDTKKSRYGKALAAAVFCKAKNNLKVFRMAVDKRTATFMARLWSRVAEIDKRQNRAIEKILKHRPIKGRALSPARPVWLVPPGSPTPRTRLKHGVWFIISRIP